MGAGFAEKRRALWRAVFCPEPEANALGNQLGNKFRYCRLSQPIEKMGMSIVANKTDRGGGPIDGFLDLAVAGSQKLELESRPVDRRALLLSS